MRARIALTATFIAALALAAALAGCANASSTLAGPGGTIQVVAAENTWGSIAEQLGGKRVQVTSIISNPNADPHDYEPTVADARTFATADLVVYNGPATTRGSSSFLRRALTPAASRPTPVRSSACRRVRIRTCGTRRS